MLQTSWSAKDIEPGGLSHFLSPERAPVAFETVIYDCQQSGLHYSLVAIVKASAAAPWPVA